MAGVAIVLEFFVRMSRLPSILMACTIANMAAKFENSRLDPRSGLSRSLTTASLVTHYTIALRYIFNTATHTLKAFGFKHSYLVAAAIAILSAERLGKFIVVMPRLHAALAFYIKVSWSLSLVGAKIEKLGC